MTHSRILGLDISSTFVFACLLTAPEDNPREWFRNNRNLIEKFEATRADLERLKALEPDYVVLEPTGIHYSKLWADHLAASGVPILWVGHSQLKSYRLTLRLPNKNDAADAFALAQYGATYLDQPGYFLSLDIHGKGYHLRQLALQIGYLESLTVQIKNRLRQQLAHEWPEVAKTSTTGSLWRFIAGLPVHKGTQTRLTKSLEATAGSGLTNFTRFLAQELSTLEDQIEATEVEMVRLYHSPGFARYQRVFAQYGIRDRVGSMVLSHIYPLENFLGPNQEEIVETVTGSNGKASRRYRSLKSFKLALGAGLVEDSSGQSEKWIPGGSTLCRRALWQWLFTKIEVRKNRPNTPQAQLLGELLDQHKVNKTPLKLARSRTICKAVELLFYDLLDSIKN